MGGRRRTEAVIDLSLPAAAAAAGAVVAGVPVFLVVVVVVLMAYAGARSWVDLYGGRLYVSTTLPFAFFTFTYGGRVYVAAATRRTSLPALGLPLGVLPVYLVLVALAVADYSTIIVLAAVLVARAIRLRVG